MNEVDLHDIVLPEPVSRMPQTSAWWVLLGLLLVVLGCAVYVFVRRWRANRYRRQALARLDDLEDAVAIPVLVKQTALAAWPRSEIASLSGDPWLRFLDASYGGNGFTEGPGRLLPTLAYEARALDPEEQRALVGVVRDWIRGHRVRV